MSANLDYGSTAKILHWSIVALLATQYLIGWLMPDTGGRMTPGAAMIWHISIGTTILALMSFRLVWRIMHPVAPERSLRSYERVSSETTHWLLYALVLLTTLSGWLFASARGWAIDWFFWFRLPMLTSKNHDLVQILDGWHQVFEWTLLVLIGVHITAALAHLFFYRDGLVGRMLPNGWSDSRRPKSRA